MFRSTWVQCKKYRVHYTGNKLVLALVLLGVFTSIGEPVNIGEITNKNTAIHHAVIAESNNPNAAEQIVDSSNLHDTAAGQALAVAKSKVSNSISAPSNIPSGQSITAGAGEPRKTGITASPAINLNVSNPATPTTKPYVNGAAWNPLLLAVNINGAELEGVTTIFQNSNGDLIVSEQDLLNWRLGSSKYKTIMLEGKPYVRIADLPGVQHHIDFDSQTLILQASASAFAATGLDGEIKDPSNPAISQAGGFFNYDLNWQRTHHQESAGGLFEIGAFNAYGNGTNTAVWRNGSLQPGLVRLDTTWNVDMPSKMQSMRFGDAISRGSSWGRSVRFGGFQWRTNFATQPDFTTFPMPTMRGEAVLPSTIDLYVNNARRLQNNVEPGPFDLANVPVVTGQGELQLVVRDLLGRQQIITQPYYASQSLLRPGLHDFSYEVGAIRKNYGIDSMRYGHLMVSATDRLGLGPGFTRELRAEVLSNQQTVGANGVWLMPQVGSAYLGTLNFGAAVSNSSGKTGQLITAGTERQSRNISYSLQSQYADRDFTQLGQLLNFSPRSTFTASIGLPLGGNSFGLNYLSQSTWEGVKNRLLSVNISRGLGSFGYLSLNALKSFTNEPHNSLSVILTIPLDKSTNLSVDISRQGDLERKSMQVQSAPPEGDGFGYRLRATDNNEYLASGTLNTQLASFNAETARANGQEGYRFGASGGVAIAGGSAFLSRRIDDSFAIVKVDNYPDVRVYRENQEITRTDQHGRALVTRLRGYQKNLISIEQEDLPLDAEVDTLHLRLTPALRSGVIADFPVRRSRSASFQLVGEDGKALAPGTVVQLEGDTREFPVGYDGRVFISGLNSNNRLFSQWSGRRCSLELTLSDTKELLPDLGTLTCKGVPP